MMDWISVDDKLPLAFTPCLISWNSFCGGDGVGVGSMRGSSWLLDNYGLINSVTHWMPMPKHPESMK